MTKRDLVLADRDRQVGQRRLSDRFAVDPDLCPRKGVDADAAIRGPDCEWYDLPRLALHRLPRARAQCAVDQIQVVDAGRRDDGAVGARAEQSFALENVYFDGR